MRDRFDSYDPYDTRDLHGAYDSYDSDEADDRRVRHLVFLDGLLVDSYAESAAYSPYACLALENDAARRRAAAPPPPPPVPEHEQVLEWLDSLVGGRRRLLELDAAPLEDRPSDQVADHPAYDAAADLLERVAGEVFDDEEVWTAAHHVLDRVWANDESLLTERRSVPQVAGGVLWVVGRANGLFGPAPAVRQRDVQRALWLKQALSGTGQIVERCVRNLDVGRGSRPWLAPRLQPCGDPGILTSRTRADLLGWRDRALETQERHRLDEQAKGVLPPEAES